MNADDVTGTVAGPEDRDAPHRRKRAKKGEGDRLRDELLAATESLLLESGDDRAVSVKAIADRVGCTAPAIYLHFGDKRELIFEVVARHFESLREAVDAARAGIDDPLVALREGCAAVMRFGLAHPEHYRIMFMGKAMVTPEQYQDGSIAEVFGFPRLVARIEECMASGRLPDGNARLVASCLMTAMHGEVAMRISRPEFDWPPQEAAIAHVLDTYLRGLRAGAAPADAAAQRAQ